MSFPIKKIRARRKYFTVDRSAYLAFRFFSSLAAFFSFMVLAGFFLSLFFESIPLLIFPTPSWLQAAISHFTRPLTPVLA
jgi:hypothetical protein